MGKVVFLTSPFKSSVPVLCYRVGSDVMCPVHPVHDLRPLRSPTSYHRFPTEEETRLSGYLLKPTIVYPVFSPFTISHV